MRKCLSNHAEVCHVWASRSQDEGYSGNIYFDSDTIYSYGSHFKMAKFHTMPNGRKVVLVNPDTYSNSTSGHQSLVTRALNGLSIETVRVPPAFWNSYIDGKAWFIGKIKEHYQLSSKARENASYHSRAALELQSRLSNWAKLHKRTAKYELTTDDLAIIERAKQQDINMKDRVLKREAVAKAKRDAELKELNEICNGDVNQYWRINGDLPYGFSVWQHLRGDTLCRLSNDQKEIETSRGAKVSVIEAKMLYHLIKAGKPVHGRKIGFYTVISCNGELKIGCHTISRNEIDLLAKTMNW